MKIIIRTKSPQFLPARTKYSDFVYTRYVYFYYNLKVDNWRDFIEYVKKYKNKGV